MPNPHPISHLGPDSAAKGRAAQHFTRKWYKETLLKIFRGEIKCNSTQLTALCKFADQRGWITPVKRRAVPLKDKPKSKPAITTDIMQRLAWFNSSAGSHNLTTATDCNATQTQA